MSTTRRSSRCGVPGGSGGSSPASGPIELVELLDAASRRWPPCSPATLSAGPGSGRRRASGELIAGRVAGRRGPRSCSAICSAQLAVDGPRGRCRAAKATGRAGGPGASATTSSCPWPALVGEDAAVVHDGHPGGIPGVGGLAGARLAGVAQVGVQSGTAEKVAGLPGAALGAVDGASPGVGHPRRAVLAGARSRSPARESDRLLSIMPSRDEPVEPAWSPTVVTVAVVPLTSRLAAPPQRACSSTRSPARYSRSLLHPGPVIAGPARLPLPARRARMRSARSSASVWDTTSAATWSAPKRVDVRADSPRPSPPGWRPGWCARAPSRYLPGPQLLRRCRLAPRLGCRPRGRRLVGGVDLAAVDRQPGRRDGPAA